MLRLVFGLMPGQLPLVAFMTEGVNDPDIWTHGSSKNNLNGFTVWKYNLPPDVKPCFDGVTVVLFSFMTTKAEP